LQGIILVYDVSSETSFLNIHKWLDNIEKSAPENTQILLIGNKCDLIDERQVSTDKGQEVRLQLTF
jgi:GTPase SAR1 family protein